MGGREEGRGRQQGSCLSLRYLVRSWARFPPSETTHRATSTEIHLNDRGWPLEPSLSSLGRRCVQTTKTPFSVSGFRNGGDDGDDDGGRSGGRLDDGFLRGKSERAGGRRQQGARRQRQRCSVRPAPPRPTLLLEQAGNRAREGERARSHSFHYFDGHSGYGNCANVAK